MNIKRNIKGECAAIADRHSVEHLGWGFRIIATNELEAFKMAYQWKDNPHGTKVEWLPNLTAYSVTVWNKEAKAMGCDA